MTRAERRLRGSAAQDVLAKLSTQSGPRTAAPMWVRPLLTSGEWDVYTALWSYPSGSVFPTHQDLCDRAICERGTAADAIARFEELGLLVREARQRADGSRTSNTYYLLEVPTATQLEEVAARRAARQAKQDAKRRTRKARNRTYAARSGSVGASTGGTAGTVPPVDGGTAQEVPPGCGADRTSGGTVHGVPGFGVGSTHETLGVDVLPKGAVRASSSSTALDQEAESTAADSGGQPREEAKPHQDSTMGDQEKPWTIPRDFYPELTGPEAELLAELVEARPDWSPRRIRQVLGSPPIRDRSEVDWDLVRRAFRLGAACRPNPDRGRQGTVTPTRLLHDACPHWREALAQREAEQADAGPPAADAASTPAEPSRPPAQRRAPLAMPPAAPPPEYLMEKEANAERAAARREGEDRAARDRQERLTAVMAELGVSV